MDPFEGSGTTGIASVELGRNYVGIDLNEKFSREAHEQIKNTKRLDTMG